MIWLRAHRSLRATAILFLLRLRSAARERSFVVSYRRDFGTESSVWLADLDHKPSRPPHLAIACIGVRNPCRSCFDRLKHSARFDEPRMIIGNHSHASLPCSRHRSERRTNEGWACKCYTAKSRTPSPSLELQEEVFDTCDKTSQIYFY